ncbi:MAG: hypothetical protein PQJ60_15320 [Spirochaetales bacterium]|nr:hypothetical protein [Spirochaetales bacterium]
MDQLYEFTGTLRSMTIEKSLFKRLGPFWKEDRPEFFEKREYDSHGRLILCERSGYRELYAYMVSEGKEADFRRAALYRFDGEGILQNREIWHYREDGTLRGKEIYRGEDPVRLVEAEEDRDKGVLVEKEEGRIRGKQHDREGRLLSEYLYRGSEADLITRYSYNESGHLHRKEETDRQGNPVKTTHYRCNRSGLILEEEERDKQGLSLYHRVYNYPGGEDENWLIREEYALNGKGKRIPLSVVYRSLNFFHEPRLAPEEEMLPPSPVAPAEEKPQKTVEMPPESTEPEQGTKVFSNGFYRGEFLKGLMEGKGVFSFNDGSYYRGEFHKGHPEGRGELKKADGSFYQGDFVRGMMHGKGVMEWADGSRYEGPFRQGLMEGIGVYTWPGGDRFRGLFEKGRRTDQGLVERNS